MKKYIYIIIILLVAAGSIWFLSVRLAWFSPPFSPGDFSGQNSVDDQATVPYAVEEVAVGLKIPWEIVFTSAERLLVTERTGALRVILNGQLQPQPLHVFKVSTSGEEGLMSVVLDPDYADNKKIYLSYAYEDKGKMFVKVVKFTDQETLLADEQVIIDQIPATQYHAGSRLGFGPDGLLYVTTGDATDKSLPQDLTSLAGKILRLNPDGSVPADNPVPNSPVWSYGHRNPQGLAWHSGNQQMYSSEHGPSVFDGPAGGDEINRIIKGKNYGWPLVSHNNKKEGTVFPLALFTPAEAPGSLMIYSGKVFPQFKNNLFFGALKGEGIIRLIVADNDPDKITFFEKLPEVKYGRIRAVVEAPDGLIYFSTSNRDGRGNPAAADDRIFRIKPVD